MIKVRSNKNAWMLSVTKLSTYSSKTLVTAGFSTMLLLLALFVGLWINNLSDNKQIVHQLNNEQTNARSLLGLYYMLNEQQKLLDRIPVVEDLAEKQRLFIEFKRLLGLMESLELTSDDVSLHYDVRETKLAVKDFVRQQMDIIGPTNLLIGNGFFEKAYEEFLSEAGPRVTKFKAKISSLINYDLLDNTNKDIESVLHRQERNYQSSYYLMAFMGTFGLSLGIFTIFVVRSTGRAEDAVLEQGKRIRALHEIIARPDLTFDQQIDETLRLGCNLLGTEIGKLGRQDPENNASEFLNTIVMSDLPAKRGIVLPLDKTFCQVTFNSPETIAISHVAESEFKNHPAASFLGMQSYIGCSINVHGKKFGTVNFSNRIPVARPFTEADKDLVNLMGSWISIMMERQLDAEELQHSKDAADAANQAKSAFLANMSHEIRTPLTAILGYSDMLRDFDQPREDVEHEVDSIIRSGSHLQRIINDILDLSKIEAGQLVIEQIEVQPAPILHDVESIFGARAREKGVEFKIDYDYPVPRVINSDPTRLKQIIFNLCGNAIKFTESGMITVKMSYLQDQGMVKFQVIDTGIGMNEEEMSRLFTPFSQADSSTTRKYGGTGLGLCISRELCQKLGGEISVSSEKGKGTTFEFTVSDGAHQDMQLIHGPEDVEERITDDGAGIVKNSLVGHVLVVEDSPDNQDLICKYLIKAGVTAEVVDNGLMAVQKAMTSNYDLIIMDVQMPIMDGLTATKKLRAEGYKGPIAILTANALKEDRDKCLKAGANNYMTKPIVVNEFYATLKEHLDAADKGLNVA